MGELAQENEQCATCPYFKYCAGGCRAMAYVTTRTKLGPDLSKCAFFRGGYHEKIEAALPGWTNYAPIK